jgi:hypothetical protein
MGLLFKSTKKTTIETEDNEPYQPIRSQAIDWQLPLQSVPITSDVVGSTPAQGDVYNIMW